MMLHSWKSKFSKVASQVSIQQISTDHDEIKYVFLKNSIRKLANKKIVTNIF